MKKINSELSKMLIQLYEIKKQKNDVVRNQQYEKAAKLRDIKRNLEREAYCLLFNSTDDSYDWNKYDDGIRKYLKENYNIEYDSIESFKQMVRIMKLNDLGI